jgi:Tfp pilus assembly protein PilN
MIEINLLPGSGKKAKGRSGGPNIGAALSGAFAQIKEPFLVAAVACVVLAVVAVGGLFVTQRAASSDLEEREQRAVQDSTRFASVLKEKRKAEAQRDSVIRQLNIIKSIDNDRFVWPHVMDEVSRALPPYTWLTAVAQTSAVPTLPTTADAPPAAAAAPAAGAPAAAADKPAHKPDSAQVAPPPMKFRIVGNTVDIQALTRFMKVLEASPFVQNVTLAKSNIATVEGKEVTEFQLDAEYQRPDPAVIHTVPVALSVR